jgi:hypothetical protein
MDVESGRPYLNLVEKLGVLHEHEALRIATGWCGANQATKT